MSWVVPGVASQRVVSEHLVVGPLFRRPEPPGVPQLAPLHAEEQQLHPDQQVPPAVTESEPGHLPWGKSLPPSLRRAYHLLPAENHDVRGGPYENNIRSRFF